MSARLPEECFPVDIWPISCKRPADILRMVGGHLADIRQSSGGYSTEILRTSGGNSVDIWRASGGGSNWRAGFWERDENGQEFGNGTWETLGIPALVGLQKDSRTFCYPTLISPASPSPPHPPKAPSTLFPARFIKEEQVKKTFRWGPCCNIPSYHPARWCRSFE